MLCKGCLQSWPRSRLLYSVGELPVQHEKRAEKWYAEENPHRSAICAICFCKTLSKAGSRKWAIGIDGSIHRMPSSVPKNFQFIFTCIKRFSLVKKASACCIRLSDKQKRVNHITDKSFLQSIFQLLSILRLWTKRGVKPTFDLSAISKVHICKIRVSRTL